MAIEFLSIIMDSNLENVKKEKNAIRQSLFLENQDFITISIGLFSIKKA
jgi:hypothetical protein